MVEALTDALPLLEGLSEAALIARGGRVVASNAAARAFLGTAIDGDPLDRVIAHPAALEALDRAGTEDSEKVALTGLGGSRRHWVIRSAALADGTHLIRFVD